MDIMWRLTHDPARHTLAARKPMVVNTTELSLKNGAPLTVLWPTKAVARGPAGNISVAGAGEDEVPNKGRYNVLRGAARLSLFSGPGESSL